MKQSKGGHDSRYYGKAQWDEFAMNIYNTTN